MSNGKSILCLLLCLILGFIGGLWLGRQKTQSRPQQEETREAFIDTLSNIDPTPVDSVPVRTDVVTLPIAKEKHPDKPIFAENPISAEVIDSVAVAISPENPPDSAKVEIPITQYEYGDSTYHLLVSGFHVSVDEMTVYPRREVVTIKKPPKRWHIGISAGYGFTPKGFQPTIAITATYSIFSF